MIYCKNCEDDFFSLFFAKNLATLFPLKAIVKLFSEQARARILSWGGKCSMTTFRRVPMFSFRDVLF